MKDDYSDLIQYLDERFASVDNQFKEVKAQFSVLQRGVDVYAGKAELIVWKNGYTRLRIRLV